MLLELAEESPAFKEQLVELARSWLTLAILEDLVNRRADQACKDHLQ